MEIKVYLSDIETLGSGVSFDALLQTLPECRRQKVLRLRNEEARRRSLGAGLLLAHALAPFGRSEAEAEYGPYGKPYIPEGTGPYFNLSHSGSRVMCVIAENEVGCDVEKIRYRRDTDRIARRYFAPEEIQALEAVQKEKKRKKLFFRYWTLKESFLKTVGSGLLQPLDQFCIRLSEEEISVCPAAGSIGEDPGSNETESELFFEKAFGSGGYDLREFFLDDGYCYAVCLAGGQIPRDPEPEWIDLGSSVI